MDRLKALKPDITVQGFNYSPSAETLGGILDKNEFEDIYHDVFFDDKQYYARLNREKNIELILTFPSIDEFGDSTSSNVMLECRSYKDRFLAVVWTIHDPKNPLGFPVSFCVSDRLELYKAVRFIEQDAVWLHYLGMEGGDLIHIFSEAVTIPPADKPSVITSLFEAVDYEEKGQDYEIDLPGEKSAHDLAGDRLAEAGVGYMLNFSKLADKLGEKEAEETVMDAVLQAVDRMKNHALPQLRDSSFLVWAAQESLKQGERLLTVFITPRPANFYEAVQGYQSEEDPFSPLFFSFSEFMGLTEGKPADHGAYPLLEYAHGKVFFLESDQSFQNKMASIYSFSGDNPYKET